MIDTKYTNKNRKYTYGCIRTPPERKSSVESVGTACAPAKSQIERDLFSPIENQGFLGFCCSNAVISAGEFRVRSKTGDFLDLSRLYSYKTTCALMGCVGDCGATIRATAIALKMFGTLPEFPTVDGWKP